MLQDLINIDPDISEKDKQRYLINEIMNFLYYECSQIDLYSTNELERIIIFSGYNKQKTYSLIENNTKDEIFKMIEDSDLKSFNLKKTKSNQDVNNSQINVNSQLNNQIQNRKEINRLGIKRNYFEEEEDPYTIQIKVWSFIKPSVNLVDLKDLLRAYDHIKLISRARKECKDRDNYKINEYFEKFYESREKKLKEIFKANLEDNDIDFIGGDEKFKEYELKRQKRKIMMNLTDNLLKSDLSKFYPLFLNSNQFVKTNILEYLDIFSIGKLGLVTKPLYSFIFNKFNLDRIAKKYCLSIFKNTNLYINEQSMLKDKYKSYMSMLVCRPRIRYSGVYYSRVKYNKTGDNHGFNNSTIQVSYYRIYRFLPSGDVFSITTPYIKQNKILNAINKQNVELRRARYYIESDDTLIIEMDGGKECSYIYRYKITHLTEFPDLKFNSLELIDYSLKSNNLISNIHVTEYFPRLFKFRCLDILKEEFFIYREYEF